MITRLEATRYRCFERLAIDLSEFQIIVGANGAGKTTLLDIPVLLGELLRADNLANVFLVKSPDKPARASNFRQLIFAQRGDDFSFAVEARLSEDIRQKLVEFWCGEGVTPWQKELRESRERWPTHIRYELHFNLVNERELRVFSESLFLFPDSAPLDRSVIGSRGIYPPYHQDWHPILKRESKGICAFKPEGKFSLEDKFRHEEGNSIINLEHLFVKPDILAMSMVKYQPDAFPAANWLYELLTEQTVFLNPDWSKLRSASPPGQEKTIIPSALNLPWLALDLKKQGMPADASETEKAAYRHPDYTDWVAHVKTALPQVEDIDVREREDDHHAYFSIRYVGGYEVPSSGLSDGTLRILTLTLLPYLSKTPKLIAVEEPENGIHPQAIMAVMQSLSSLYHSQVLVSSHSPIVLAGTRKEILLCAQLSRSGGVEILSGDKHPHLQTWRGEISLGTLFAAGVLG
ncbi:MAG: AAA family ATPase [Proteobacteria bacterium]|nr:AAA family ATPase [Pseudomonadota bacterium]